MINASGFKGWPAEVEALVHRHPTLRKVCVVGVRDSRRGETFMAFVELKSEYRTRVDEGALIAWSRENMAAYKALRLIEFVESLPRAGGGKVMWRELQERQTSRDRLTVAGKSTGLSTVLEAPTFVWPSHQPL